MRVPHYIKKLAADIVAVDDHMGSAASFFTTEEWIEDVANRLMEWRDALLSGRYYTRVESVSRSGMSRVIVIARGDHTGLINAPAYIYRLAGCDRARRIHGCGMDMLFAAQYNLFVTLCPRRYYRYQDSMPRYRDLP